MKLILKVCVCVCTQEREKILNNQNPLVLGVGKNSTNTEEGGNVFNMLNAKKTHSSHKVSKAHFKPVTSVSSHSKWTLKLKYQMTCCFNQQDRNDKKKCG